MIWFASLWLAALTPVPEAVAAKWCIDKKRVFFSGHSDGGTITIALNVAFEETRGFATAIARGRWEALIGAVLFALGCWMKARQEERFLSEELGAEYAAYRKRVPMLVPFLKF